MQCAQCATPVPDDAKFCHSCGSLVSDAEGQAAATAAMDKSATEQMESLLRQATKGVYDIEGMLGKGGMAAVYLATERALSRKVAIKVLPPELTFGHGVERFTREAKTAAALDHPHIIPVYRVSTGGAIFWYAMKFLEGRALDELIKERKTIPLKETIKILEQVADALDYAHEQEVIHRDIKPANVMLDARQRVIVTDFGIAKALTEVTLTASGAVVGTPYFMSPEQATGTGVGPGSDQYSTAVMAYQMLSGQLPFEGESTFDVLRKQCSEPPPPLDVLVPSLPEYVYRAIATGMAKKPEHRFETVTAFVAGLKAPWKSRSGGTTEIFTDASELRESLSTEPKKTSGRKATTIATAIVVASGIGAGGWWWATKSEPETIRIEGSDPPIVASALPTDSIGMLQPTTGVLRITNLPSGGRVRINDSTYTGTQFALDTGTYELQLNAQGFQPTTQTVSLVAGDTTSIAFNRRAIRQATVTEPPTPVQARPRQAPEPTTGIVQINTTGSWARITVDGVFKRESNRYQEELNPGLHLFRFEAPGFATVDTTVTVAAGDTLRLTITMREQGDTRR